MFLRNTINVNIPQHICLNSQLTVHSLIVESFYEFTNYYVYGRLSPKVYSLFFQGVWFSNVSLLAVKKQRRVLVSAFKCRQ